MTDRPENTGNNAQNQPSYGIDPAQTAPPSHPPQAPQYPETQISMQEAGAQKTARTSIILGICSVACSFLPFMVVFRELGNYILLYFFLSGVGVTLGMVGVLKSLRAAASGVKKKSGAVLSIIGVF